MKSAFKPTDLQLSYPELFGSGLQIRILERQRSDPCHIRISNGPVLFFGVFFYVVCNISNAVVTK